ncbi:hypothetical protein DM02DRAFT_636684 [Periconia macrospinosa]|uniref:Uncharacterized protein n=1 Tax=Periconia macrospinosa TaxID=97972 RepID=A0A2V1CY13_9PLEO|nr:hypothetical protein DM02DRAFT_636684 [Periconia macrospinosa]
MSASQGIVLLVEIRLMILEQLSRDASLSECWRNYASVFRSWVGKQAIGVPLQSLSGTDLELPFLESFLPGYRRAARGPVAPCAPACRLSILKPICAGRMYLVFRMDYRLSGFHREQDWFVALTRLTRDALHLVRTRILPQAELICGAAAPSGLRAEAWSTWASIGCGRQQAVVFERLRDGWFSSGYGCSCTCGLQGWPPSGAIRGGRVSRTVSERTIGGFIRGVSSSLSSSVVSVVKPAIQRVGWRPPPCSLAFRGHSCRGGSPSFLAKATRVIAKRLPSPAYSRSRDGAAPRLVQRHSKLAKRLLQIPAEVSEHDE